MTVRLQSEQATGSDRERLTSPRWGITLAERSYKVGCGGSSFTLFVNEDVGESVTSAERLFERLLIAGLLARWYPAGIRAAPQLLASRCPHPRGEEPAHPDR